MLALAGLGVELIGVALLVACSAVRTPPTSADYGSVALVDLGHACRAGDCGDTPVSEIVVATGSAWTEDCCPGDWRYYFVSGPLEPSSPVLTHGDSVVVRYQDLVRGRSVLSITTNPGRAGSATYLTADYNGYKQSLALGRLAAAGLVAGALLAVAGAVAVVLAGRNLGAPAGALAAAAVPPCLLPAAALANLVTAGAGGRLTLGALVGIAAAAALVGLFAGFASRRLDERPPALAISALIGVGALTLLWLVGGIATAVVNLSRALY